MPESIDWPRMHPTRRRRFLLILVVLAGIVFGGRTALSYYMDVLWFESLGYRDVFWKTLGLQWGIFTAFAAATFLILYGIVSDSEASASARSAERSYRFHRRTAAAAAG